MKVKYKPKYLSDGRSICICYNDWGNVLLEEIDKVCNNYEEDICATDNRCAYCEHDKACHDLTRQLRLAMTLQDKGGK